MKMEQCSETSAYKIQTQGNYLEESIQQMQVVWLSFGLFDDTVSKYGSRLRLRSHRSLNDVSSAVKETWRGMLR